MKELLLGKASDLLLQDHEESNTAIGCNRLMIFWTSESQPCVDVWA